jgi:hypothetical protein
MPGFSTGPIFWRESRAGPNSGPPTKNFGGDKREEWIAEVIEKWEIAGVTKRL